MEITINGQIFTDEKSAMKYAKKIRAQEIRQEKIAEANRETALLHAYANYGRICQTMDAIKENHTRRWYIRNVECSCSETESERIFSGDIARLYSSSGLVTRILYKFTVTHALFNNAGFITAVKFHDLDGITEDEWYAIGAHNGISELVGIKEDIDSIFPLIN